MSLVPRDLQIPASADCRTGRPASSLSLAHPSAAGVLHVGSRMLSGPRIFQCGHTYDTTATGTHRWKVWRHPNARFLYFEIDAYVTSDQTSGIVLTAGTGASVTVPIYSVSGGTNYLGVRVTWHANDTGWNTVTAVLTDVYVRRITAFDWPRTEIAAADHGPLIPDLAHPRISLREGDPIADATDGSVRSVLVGLQQAWDDCRRVAATWSSLAPVAFTKAAPDWQNPFGQDNDFTWRHKARSEYRDDDGNDYYAWIWAAVSGGATYSLKFEAVGAGLGTDSATLTGLTTAGVTERKVGPVAVDALLDADLAVYGQITAGAGNISIYSVTIGEE